MADNINNYKSVITMDPADYDWDVIKDGYQEESKEEKEMAKNTKLVMIENSPNAFSTEDVITNDLLEVCNEEERNKLIDLTDRFNKTSKGKDMSLNEVFCLWQEYKENFEGVEEELNINEEFDRLNNPAEWERLKERLKAEEQLEDKKDNAEVTEEKEEKTMTNAPLSMSAYKAQIQAELEATKNVSFAKDTKAPKKFAQKETLGLNHMVVEKIEYITLKYEANEDKGKNARFARAWKITLKDENIPPIIINDTVFLYDGDKRVENIDIYDAIVNGAGNIGIYFTVKEDAIKNKKADELTPEDLIPHELNGQRIWRPAKQELFALAKQLKVAELDFNDDESIKIPKDFKAAIYVYEDVVKDKVVKHVKGEIKKFQTIEYFYNASFVKPEDVHNMKYGRAFTTSENAAHRAELRELPGVVRYLESC